ncbi:MAG TPA: hypothetical protein VOA80_04225 [Thermoanaerobaculia bacterium]|nr:hypothetical protein [Thermoanaerobaculia bacterium]
MASASPRTRTASSRTAFGRAAAALLLFSAWMGLLFAGFLLHGALHLLLVAASWLFPWRSLSPPVTPAGRDEPPPD